MDRLGVLVLLRSKTSVMPKMLPESWMSVNSKGVGLKSTLLASVSLWVLVMVVLLVGDMVEEEEELSFAGTTNVACVLGEAIVDFHMVLVLALDPVRDRTVVVARALAVALVPALVDVATRHFLFFYLFFASVQRIAFSFEVSRVYSQVSLK